MARLAGLSSDMQTLTLYSEGQSIAEIAAFRGMSRMTIENHLLRCAEEGESLDWEDFIPEQYEVLIVETIAEIGAEKLRPIKDALPGRHRLFCN